jgi:hypothetical protein
MSRTHGPRMNRERTREVVDKLGIPIVKSDGHGIEVHRAVAGEPERWRLHTGGGIAGNSDKVWLVPFVRVRKRAPEDTWGMYEPRGPYWNKGQLEKALRLWRKGQ